tara:strand:+ start:50 stop:271 length:222 start_codon:yes stop_codon:yes gene_type:complete
MNYYAVIAHEAFKEESAYFYEGSWSIEKLKQFTIEQIIENSDMEYDNDEEAEEDIYIDYIFKSNSNIDLIYGY